MNKQTSIALTAILASAGLSQAVVLFNFDVGTGRGTMSGAGAVGATGDFWNSTNGGTGNIAPGTTFGLDGVTNNNIGFFRENTIGGGNGSFEFGPDSSPNPLLFDYGFLNDSDAGDAGIDGALGDGTAVGVSQRFTIYTNGPISDLNVGDSYDLYLYAGGNGATQGANFQLKQDNGAGGFTYLNASVPTADLTNTAFVDGGNYIVFEDVSPTTFGGGTGREFELWLSNLDGEQFAGFRGLQVAEAGTPLAIPEPSSVLLGFLGLGFLARRRR